MSNVYIPYIEHNISFEKAFSAFKRKNNYLFLPDYMNSWSWRGLQLHHVGRNYQSINLGVMGADGCVQKLTILQEKYALLEKSVADKDIIIELLKGQR